LVGFEFDSQMQENVSLLDVHRLKRSSSD